MADSTDGRFGSRTETPATATDGGRDRKGWSVEKGNAEIADQSGEMIETFAGGPTNPIRWMPGRMAIDGVDVIEDANGDVWWKPDGKGWVLEDRLKDRLPVEIADWKARNPES